MDYANVHSPLEGVSSSLAQKKVRRERLTASSERLWLGRLVQGRYGELLARSADSLYAQEKISQRQLEELKYIIDNRTARWERVDKVLADKYQVNIATITHDLLGKEYSARFQEGAYRSLSMDILKRPEGEILFNKFKEIARDQTLALVRGLDKQGRRYLEMFKRRYSSRSKRPLDVQALGWLSNDPGLENTVISEKIGCHRKGLEKALRRINNLFTEFFKNNPELFDSLCQAYKDEFLKFLAGRLEAQEEAALLSYLETISVSLRADSQSLADLSAQEICEILKLRLIEGESYKEISKLTARSEISILRFFEGRKDEAIKEEGAIHLLYSCLLGGFMTFEDYINYSGLHEENILAESLILKIIL